MLQKPVARMGDSGSHGGTIASGSGTIFVNDKPLARAGDTYNCPIHGPNPIVDGATGILGEKELVAYVGSRTACGATILSGSPDTFICLGKVTNKDSDLTQIIEEKSFVDFQLLNSLNIPLAGEAFILTLPDGMVITGNLDSNGCIHQSNIPRGNCHIRFPSLKQPGIV
jgi:uncharacterized Zn-binding protein involved in type VI secretion